MKRGLGIVTLVGMLLLVATMTSLLLLERKTGAPQQISRSKESQPITLSIPNADPIPALVEDYRRSDSMWVVVSKTRPLPKQDYAPERITLPADISRNLEKSQEEQSVRDVVVKPLTEMLTTAMQSGHDLFLASGYRSYALQEQYYTNYVRTSGQAEADRFSAKPGFSEHQTGLSFDLSASDRECYLETCFGELPAGKWLKGNAHIYGFVVRYPADKTAITGYQYEPWHLRYVGKDLAKALYTSGMTLDEIVPQLEATRNQLIEHKLITE